MSDYIEREAAIATACDAVELYPSEYKELEKAIREVPVSDVKPVVHGKWLSAGHDGWSYYIRCTACNGLFGNMSKFKYCPNCGAKMDKEVSADDA